MEFLFPDVNESKGRDAFNNPLIEVEMHTMPQVLVQTCLYGYVLYIAANMIGDSAELLLLVPKFSSLVGSIVLPILGAVPDGMMVLCSGLGSKQKAQEQVAVGMGALAGSTIMLLTLPWFLAIWTGRVSVKTDKTLNYNVGKTEPKLLKKDEHSLTAAGVTLLPQVKKNVRMMFLTATTYILIQGRAWQFDDQQKDTEKQLDFQAGKENMFALVGLILCCVWFVVYLGIAYSAGQESDGHVEDKKIAVAVKAVDKGEMSLRGVIEEFKGTTWDSLEREGGLSQGLLTRGSQAEETVRKMVKLLVPFFGKYDKNGDKQISIEEFRMILSDLHENIGPELARKIFQAADADSSGFISFEEFTGCMVCFALDPSDKIKNKINEGGPPKRMSTANAYMLQKPVDEDGEEDEEGEAEEEDMPEDLADLPPGEQQRRIKNRAFYGMTVGTVLVLLFSDPMCDMLGLIGTLTGVPKFYVSFLLAPLASNASELVSSMKLAAKRTPKSLLQAVSTLQGACIMNNSFCLAIFLYLVYAKPLAWKFTAETISILSIEVLIGVFAMKQMHTVLDGIFILFMYPGSLVVVWVLENVLKLD